MEPLSNLTVALPSRSIQRSSPVGGSTASTSSNFSTELTKAIGAVEKMQQDADAQALSVAQGNGNLHEAALALEKADVTMRLALKVRNRFVETYQEIMRMNV